MSRYLTRVVVIVAWIWMGLLPELCAQDANAADDPAGNAGDASRDESSSVQTAVDAAEAPESFEATFWSYLQRAQYRNWAPAGSRTTELFDGSSPHGTLIKLFANRAALSNLSAPPYGAILVKENYDEQRRLQAITVMYRSRDAAPDHNDWYWTKYLPDGSVATMSDAPDAPRVTGQVISCIECHRTAHGDDYIFANDP